MSTRRVVVTGLGIISPLGNTPDEIFSKLMLGESAIREVAIDGPRPYSNVAAPSEFNPFEHLPPHLKLDHIDRVTQFAMATAAAAIKDSRIELTDENRSRAGVAFGTGIGSANALEEAFSQSLVRDPERI